MTESLSWEHFFHSALLDSLTVSVWHIQLTVTHHHTHLHWFTSHSYFHKYVHTTSEPVITPKDVKSGLLCEIKGFSPFKLQLSTSRMTFYPYLLCSLQIFLPLISFTLVINVGVVVISVPGRNPHSVFFSCMGNIGSSWVILPDRRPHVCWLKGNGRGMPAMPRQPGEAMAEHIMSAWMRGPWHQV